MESAKELAYHLCGLSKEVSETKMAELLCDKYGVFLEEFERIANDLLGLINIAKEPLSGNTRRGFAIPVKGKPGIVMFLMESA